MVADQAKGIVHSAESASSSRLSPSRCSSVIFLMNSMDFLPVDLLPKI